jgi:hypothetical protein
MLARYGRHRASYPQEQRSAYVERLGARRASSRRQGWKHYWKINSPLSVLSEKDWRFSGLPSARPHPARKNVGMLESDYIHAQPLKPLPPVPVRVSRRSQLRTALRQHARPIVIEDQELARPFARLSCARQLPVSVLGELMADTMSYALTRCYGANIEAHWYIGGYILPGNVQKVILKPKDVRQDRQQ